MEVSPRWVTRMWPCKSQGPWLSESSFAEHHESSLGAGENPDSSEELGFVCWFKIELNLIDALVHFMNTGAWPSRASILAKKQWARLAGVLGKCCHPPPMSTAHLDALPIRQDTCPYNPLWEQSSLVSESGSAEELKPEFYWGSRSSHLFILCCPSAVGGLYPPQKFWSGPNALAPVHMTSFGNRGSV